MRWSPPTTRTPDEVADAILDALELKDGDERGPPREERMRSSPPVSRSAARRAPTRTRCWSDSSCSANCPALIGDRAPSASPCCTRRRWPRTGEAMREDLAAPGLRGHRRPAAQRRGGQDRRGRRLLLEGARPDRLHPHRRDRRRRRRRHHRPGRLRRRDLAARGALDRGAHHRARHGRRGRRRQDRHQHRRGQEPGRRLPPAGRGAVRPGGAGLAAGQRLRQRAGRGHQGRVHRRPGDPRPDRVRPRGAPAPRTARTPPS